MRSSVYMSQRESDAELSDAPVARSRYIWLRIGQASPPGLFASVLHHASCHFRRSHFLDRLQRDLYRASSTKPTFEAGDSLVEI